MRVYVSREKSVRAASYICISSFCVLNSRGLLFFFKSRRFPAPDRSHCLLPRRVLRANARRRGFRRAPAAAGFFSPTVVGVDVGLGVVGVVDFSSLLLPLVILAASIELKKLETKKEKKKNAQV